MNRIQLEHIIRAASEIAADKEIEVIGSQAIHAQSAALPAVAFRSQEADVFPRNFPERSDEIDGAIGELSQFHQSFGYYAHGVSPSTAILPEGWQLRLVPLVNSNTGGATGLCLEPHDLVLSKYAAGRAKDLDFNLALIKQRIVSRDQLFVLLKAMPLDDKAKSVIASHISADFAAPQS